MNPTLASTLAIASGAAAGALLRWRLHIAFVDSGALIPLGTLLANLIGGLLIGIVIGMLDQFDTQSVPLRLAITVGFLGGLTTFSTFSAETVGFILRGEWLATVLIVVAHVLGSVLATLLGVALVRLIVR